MPDSQARRPGAALVLRRAARNALVTARDAVTLPLARRVPRDWVVVRLDHGLVELPMTPEWFEAFRPQPRALSSVLQVLDRASHDARVRGVLFRVGRAPLGWAQMADLARAVQALRAAGKVAVVYAERTGNAGAWLGACVDHFWMTHEGHLDLIGVRIDSPFLREALERLHIRPDVIQAGRYKGAAEIIARSSMSDDSREALDSVADELYTALVTALASRSGDAERARQWIDEGPYLAAGAREAGLVDDLVYSDELPRRLAALSNGATEDDEAEAPVILDSVYLRVSRRRFALEPLAEGRAEIAVVPVLGMIRSPDQSARPLVGLLRRLAEEPSVRAVVLRVNSPGGDPLASDLIWRAVEVLRQEKPVVASLSDTAASGGYYVAMGANEIVAEATTLTGSIGVVMAALEFEELLGELGVHFDGVGRGRHASIYDPYRRRSDEERAVLERQVKGLYSAFVEKAARGRDCELAALEKVAQGRVWTGSQAQREGLVDALGGLDFAVERARALAGLAPGAGEPVVYTPQVPLWQRLRGGEPLGSGALLELLCRSQLWCPLQIPLR